MDDPESKSKSKWEIQEYNYSSSKATLVRWILSTMGRQMVITGITISSAQLALPPLVVLSAMGVPFGVLYASYACTNKILSLLLPIPPSPPPPMLLDYCCPELVEEGYVTADHEEDINELGVESETVFQLDDYSTPQGQTLIVNADEDVYETEMEENILQRENVTEENEREPMVDVNEAIETRPSFDDDDDHSLEEEHKGNERLVESPDYELEPKFRDEGRVDNSVEEIDSQKPDEVGNKNDERVIVFLSDENNLKSSNAYALDMAAREVIGDAEKEETAIKFDEQVVVESSASKDGIGDAILRTMEEHVIHFNAQVQEISDENLLDERSMDNNLENFEDFDGAGDAQGYEEDVGEYLEGEDDGLHEEPNAKEPLVESWNDKNESNTVGGSASLGDVRDVETTKPVAVKEMESHKRVEVGNKNEEQLSEMHHTVILCDENNLNSSKEYSLDLAAREVIRDADKDERTIKFDETVVTKSSASTDESEYAVLRTIEEHLIHSVEDAPVISEGSLLDERKTNNLESLEVGNEVKENVVDDKVDAFARSPPSEIDNGKRVKENAGDADVNVLERSPSKQDTVNAKVASKKMRSREDNLDVDDEKIWEKIHAVKTIVGYNAPSRSTCIGELKALYVFTGVEPPASFEGDSDLDAKLKFLMAIVGVK